MVGHCINWQMACSFGSVFCTFIGHALLTNESAFYPYLKQIFTALKLFLHVMYCFGPLRLILHSMSFKEHRFSRQAKLTCFTLISSESC